MDDSQSDFYHSLRSRIRTWLDKHGEGFRHARLLLVAPDLFHLLCRLALDKRIHAGEKAKLAAAIAYFVAPIDVFPEIFMGPFAFLDDVAVAAFALNSVINAGQGEVAKELWAGDGDILVLIQQVVSTADELLGGGVWKRLRSLFD